jgi:hypothetical protein
MQDVGCFEVCGPIRNPLLIHEQREGDACFFSKKIRVSEITQPDRRNLSSCVMETGLVLAQLRDVLATENSPIMTKENKNRRSMLPKRAEP